MSGLENLEKSLAVEAAYGPNEQDYIRLINIYLKNKDFARIAESYEKFKLNPKIRNTSRRWRPHTPILGELMKPWPWPAKRSKSIHLLNPTRGFSLEV